MIYVEQAKEFKSEFQIAQKNRKENIRIEEKHQKRRTGIPD